MITIFRIKQLAFFLAIASLVTVIIVGCAPKEKTEETPKPAAEKANGSIVKIQDNTFEPETLEIVAGTEVTWKNQDSVSHTVTGDEFDSGEIKPGGEYSFIFEKEGNFTYRCDYHPMMTGEVKVVKK